MTAVMSEEGDEIHLATGDQTISGDLSHSTARLNALLEETRAYRLHFVRADGEALISVT